VYADLTLTRSKVKVKVTGLLNFRQLAKPCMLAAMTAAPLRGFLVLIWNHSFIHVVSDWFPVMPFTLHTVPGASNSLGFVTTRQSTTIEFDMLLI